MGGVPRVAAAVFAALGIVGCGDIEFGPEAEGGGSEGEEPLCDPGPGERVGCIEPVAGQCLEFDDPNVVAQLTSGGCFAPVVEVLCGPMPAPAGCCYTYVASGGEVCDGRPFVIANEPRTAAAVPRSDWAAPVGACSLPGRRGAWERRGLDEHASVAAFARFVLEMMSVGAPAQLVADTVLAMQDEVEHARLAFGLASAGGTEPVGPGPLSVDDAVPRQGLEAIACATLVEGAIGETIAAVRAATEAETETDATVRRILDQIADDEARHAALAWRFLAWALATAPHLRPVLQRTLDHGLERASPEVAHGIIRPCWRQLLIGSRSERRSSSSSSLALRL